MMGAARATVNDGYDGRSVSLRWVSPIG